MMRTVRMWVLVVVVVVVVVVVALEPVWGKDKENGLEQQQKEQHGQEEEEEEEEEALGPLGFVFIKTHKTASSTLMVMLGHALERRGQYPAFGDDGHALCSTCLGWPESFHDPERQLYGADKTNFSAIISHVRYTETTQAMAMKMLGNVPVFTLLRDPIERFISALRFFQPLELRNAGFRVTYITDSEMNRLLDLMANRTFVRSLSTYMTGHVMLSYAFDFGITDDPFIGRQEFEAAFAMARERIGLVLITEEWFLSMAFLRRHVGLHFSDLVWNDQKRHKRDVPQLSEATRARMRQALWMDFAIYEHYRREFEQQLTPLVQLEAQIIQSTQAAYVRRCQHDPSTCVRKEDDLPFTLPAQDVGDLAFRLFTFADLKTPLLMCRGVLMVPLYSLACIETNGQGKTGATQEKVRYGSGKQRISEHVGGAARAK